MGVIGSGMLCMILGILFGLAGIAVMLCAYPVYRS